MLLTVLEATVATDHGEALRAAYAAAGSRLPPGLLRSELLCSTLEPTRWRIQTLWANRNALEAVRRAGTPAGVLMFRSVGAEPTLTVFDVTATIPARSQSDA